MLNYIRLLVFNTSSIGDFGQMLGMLAVFLFIIVAAFLTTFLVARMQQGMKRNVNLEIVEGIRIGLRHSSIQLIRMGNKYAVIGVSKDHIETIAVLNEEDVMVSDIKGNPVRKPFSDILKQLKKTDQMNTGVNHHETKDE